MNKEIYIHVGPPKTGTSAVQKWLSSNQSFLKNNGIFYPPHNVDVNGVSSGNVKSIYDINEKKQLCLNKELLANLIDTFNASEFSILLLSSEFFFREMDELKLHIPNAKFIAYVRNPMEVKESGYNQTVKRHYKLEKINTVRRKRLPYMIRLVEFCAAYGAESLYLRLYGDQYFERGNIVSDLLSVVGIEANVKLPVVNNSYQFEALEFKRWFNQFHLHDYQGLVDNALQGFEGGHSHYSFIIEEQYIEDSIYYASVLEDYAKELKNFDLGPLITDMKKASSKTYFTQELSDSDFLSVCEYLQKILQLDYYLLVKKITSLEPVQNEHFHHLFIKSCSRKYRCVYQILRVRNLLRKLAKLSINKLGRAF